VNAAFLGVGAMNLGVRPTFGPGPRVCEVHLLDPAAQAPASTAGTRIAGRPPNEAKATWTLHQRGSGSGPAPDGATGATGVLVAPPVHWRLLGQTLSVELLTRLRPERRFTSPQALAAQIRRDLARARHLLRSRP
jgi:hypothetical protein